MRSTKPKGIVTKQQPEDKEPEPDGMKPPDNDSGNNLIMKVVRHQSKLYTDDTGRFPVTARAGNQYVMIAYHSSNLILAQPFANRKDQHRI